VLTLWDLIDTKRRKRRARPAAYPTTSTRSPVAHKPGSMQQKYESLTRTILTEHNIRVRKWRSSMSGVAWQLTDRQGNVTRLIESPRPKGPVSCAIFLHEIGHHAIGFSTYRPRCLEEFHAWQWSLRTMEQHNLNITSSVHKRMHDSLWYALEKAKRRGLKNVPVELLPYSHQFPRSKSQTPRTISMA
jgi:hypothetical protein